jgi:hypothetical protein
VIESRSYRAAWAIPALTAEPHMAGYTAAGSSLPPFPTQPPLSSQTPLRQLHLSRENLAATAPACLEPCAFGPRPTLGASPKHQVNLPSMPGQRAPRAACRIKAVHRSSTGGLRALVKMNSTCCFGVTSRGRRAQIHCGISGSGLGGCGSRRSPANGVGQLSASFSATHERSRLVVLVSHFIRTNAGSLPSLP